MVWTCKIKYSKSHSLEANTGFGSVTNWNSRVKCNSLFYFIFFASETRHPDVMTNEGFYLTRCPGCLCAFLPIHGKTNKKFNFSTLPLPALPRSRLRYGGLRACACSSEAAWRSALALGRHRHTLLRALPRVWRIVLLLHPNQCRQRCTQQYWTLPCAA